MRYGPRVTEAPKSGDPTIAFLLELGRALHRFGAPAHRLEAALGGVATRLGVVAQIFSSPTMLMAAIGNPGGRQQTFMLRVEPGDVDLGKLSRVDRIAVDVGDGSLSPGEGSLHIAEVVGAPPSFGGAAQVPAWALTSASVAVFLGGGGRDVAVAGAIGLLVGLLSAALGRREAQARLFELLAAFVAAFGARAASTLVSGTSAQVMLLAGLIVLLPGLTLTTAMTELATRNLVSGTARLTAAAIVFMELAFGVALGDRLALAWLGPAPSVAPVALPWWVIPPVLLISVLSLVVLFRAERRHVGFIVAAGFIGFYGARLGAGLLSPELGASLGAFLAGVFSNLYARSGRGPALVPMVPGILLLVPGSLGLRSLSSLLEDDVVRGIDSAFTMILVAVSIVAGLLFANAAMPPRREL